MPPPRHAHSTQKHPVAPARKRKYTRPTRGRPTRSASCFVQLVTTPGKGVPRAAACDRRGLVTMSRSTSSNRARPNRVGSRRAPRPGSLRPGCACRAAGGRTRAA
eukprot:4500776-Prymnesium_polylepis.1